MSWVTVGEALTRPAQPGKTQIRPCHETLHTLIPLHGKQGGGQFAKVSLEDYRHLSCFRWHANNNGYARRSLRRRGKQFGVFMHRVIAARAGLVESPYSDFLPDHRNRNRLDNRRSNIRLATDVQNAHNGTHLRNSFGFIGVGWTKKGRFIAQVSYKGKQYGLSGFPTAEEAARVRDAMARHYHKEFAVTNFAEGDSYDLSTARKRKLEARGYLSVYTGVTLKRKTGKWMARFKKADQETYLGVFLSEEAAARAYDAARVAHGMSKVNFPDDV